MPTSREYGRMMIEQEQNWERVVLDMQNEHRAEILALMQQIQALQAIITGGEQ